MKTLFSVIAAAAVLGFAAPTSAKAECQGETRIVGYTAYGAPIVSVYQIVGYDGYGRPIGRWVTQGPQGGYGYGGVQRPIIVRPSINFGFGGYNSGCNTGHGYHHGSSHHRGFRR
ncbi:hypothetical protein [Prosthecobacter sp.]|uniref:hypothetical protein n=1 Tax=Prosthecobacter sp. TaxID=1965333 RepID=UPI00248991F8|nr:hypothetical protein [Prosthecobacter sp.]MDI1311042.1 hypothetical protein [Prosthecobacter sp.]